VVPDTSCLIALKTLDLADLLLSFYAESMIPSAVAIAGE
jgi:hypothetical protein